MKHLYRPLSLLIALLMLALTACTPAPTLPENDTPTPPATDTTDDTPTSTPESDDTPESEQTPSLPPEQNENEEPLGVVEKMSNEEITDVVEDHPARLLGFSENERYAILRRYLDNKRQDMAPTAVIPDMRISLYDIYCVGSEEDHFGYRLYYMPSLTHDTVPGETEYLVLEYSVSGTLIGTSVLIADEEPTLPATPADYFAVNNSLERLNIILKNTRSQDPMAYLREAWADDYLGTRDGVDYYITSRKTTRDGMDIYNIRGLQRTIEDWPIVKIASGSATDVKIKEGVLPISASTPAVVAAQPEADRLSYMQALAAEEGFHFTPTPISLRQRAANYWGSHLIGSEADRDYFALQPITDRDRYNGTQVEALVLIYAPDGSIKDVQLTQMSAAPYGDAQTLVQIILSQYQHYVSGMKNDAHLLWINSYAQALGYRGTQARTLIREALSEYYDHTEEPRFYNAVDFFLLPVEGGEPIQLWIEYDYINDRIDRIRIGEFILDDVQI